MDNPRLKQLETQSCLFLRFIISTLQPMFQRLDKKASIVFTMLVFWALHATAQIQSPGKPFFIPSSDTLFVPQINITENLIPVKQKSGSMFKVDEFAKPIILDIKPEEYGVWLNKPAYNRKILLLAIKINKASSLSLLLKPFELKEGVKLFFYDSLQTQVIGAITSKNNKQSGVLPLRTIKGDVVYCEIQMPTYMDKYGQFTIAKIGAGYPKEPLTLKSTEDEYFGAATLPCHLNVNCYDFPKLNYTKQATCRIVFLTTKRCTGTLLNNLSNDRTPYVITAAHCFNVEEVANEAVIYFNYESPGCENKEVTPQTISGATVVSAGFHVLNKYDSLDFTLIKLSEKPPIDYDVYYQGWDATNTPSTSSYVLHHPQGDIKKISIENDPVTTVSFPEFEPNTHWYVTNYEVGATERGSSGAGLINQKHRLIGTLTGGVTSCTEDAKEGYQKLYTAYDFYSDKKYQLKNWLDPYNSDKRICNGILPYKAFRSSAQKLFNFDTASGAESIRNNLGEGYIAGHNYQENKLFAEKISVKGSKYLIAVDFYPANAGTTAENQYITIKVWADNNQPGKVIYEQKKLISDFEDLFARGPDSPYHITFDSAILVSKNFYVGYEIGYTSGGLFALQTYKANSDKNTAFTHIGDNWEPLQRDGENYPANLALTVFAYDVKANSGVFPDTTDWNEFRIYPNPSQGDFQVYFTNNPPKKAKFTFYTLSGQTVYEEEVIAPPKNYPLQPNLKRGIYTLQINTDSYTKAQKILVF